MVIFHLSWIESLKDRPKKQTKVYTRPPQNQRMSPKKGRHFNRFNTHLNQRNWFFDMSFVSPGSFTPKKPPKTKNHPLPGDSKCPFHPLVGVHSTPWKGHLTIPKRSLWITRSFFLQRRFWGRLAVFSEFFAQATRGALATSIERLRSYSRDSWRSWKGRKWWVVSVSVPLKKGGR